LTRPASPGGPRSRRALADFRVTGALPVLVPRSVGVDDLVSQRLLPGDPAAHAGPGRDVVDAYAPAVDWGHWVWLGEGQLSGARSRTSLTLGPIYPGHDGPCHAG
jgi:hypothetical protein